MTLMAKICKPPANSAPRRAAAALWLATGVTGADSIIEVGEHSEDGISAKYVLHAV